MHTLLKKEILWKYLWYFKRGRKSKCHFKCVSFEINKNLFISLYHNSEMSRHSNRKERENCLHATSRYQLLTFIICSCHIILRITWIITMLLNCKAVPVMSKIFSKKLLFKAISLRNDITWKILIVIPLRLWICNLSTTMTLNLINFFWDLLQYQVTLRMRSIIQIY